MDLVKYDLAIVTMEISVSTYSEMVREEATSIGNAHCSPNNSNLLIISVDGALLDRIICLKSIELSIMII